MICGCSACTHHNSHLSAKQPPFKGNRAAGALQREVRAIIWCVDAAVSHHALIPLPSGDSLKPAMLFCIADESVGKSAAMASERPSRHVAARSMAALREEYRSNPNMLCDMTTWQWQVVDSFKYLGVHINNKQDWTGTEIPRRSTRRARVASTC